MQWVFNDQIIGYGDDVLQLFDQASASWVGRHRQIETAVRRDGPYDRQLVIDECVHVLHSDPRQPVADVACAILLGLDEDPDTLRPRVDAGTPTQQRLINRDARAEKVDQLKETAADLGADAAGAVSRGLGRAQRWLDQRSQGSE